MSDISPQKPFLPRTILPKTFLPKTFLPIRHFSLKDISPEDISPYKTFLPISSLSNYAIFDSIN